MPFPPPPKAAFTSKGNPILGACAFAWSMSTGSAVPGTIGIPAASAMRRAADLSPIVSIAAAGGPTKVSPASVTAAAKAARSARNP